MATIHLPSACMQRSIARLLRLSLALLLPFSLALLPRLHYNCSFPTPPPIFILANFLVLAIAISSRFPPHISFPTLNHSGDASPHYAALPIALRSIPMLDLPSAVPQQRTRQLSRLSQAVSNELSKPALPAMQASFFEGQSAVLCEAFHQPIVKYPKQLSGDVGAEILPAEELQKLAISDEIPRKKPLAVKPAQNQHIVATTRTVGQLVRSKSHPTIRASETAPTVEKFIRRTVTMDGTQEMSFAPFESLMDEDFCKRCAEFIANNHEKWKKESLERTS